MKIIGYYNYNYIQFIFDLFLVKITILTNFLFKLIL